MTPAQQVNAAVKLYRAGQTAEAEQICRQVLSQNPGHGDATHLLGVIALTAGRHAEAVDLFQNAIAASPPNADQYFNLGLAFLALDRRQDAIAALRRSLSIRPGLANPQCQLRLGIALSQTPELDDALAALRAAASAAPEDPAAQFALGTIYQQIGQLDRAIESFEECIRLKPDHHEAESARLFTLYMHPDSDEQSLLREHLLWNQHHAEPLRKLIKPPTNDPSPNRRLRLGFVSGDFREHTVAWNFLPFLQNLDLKQFEAFLYSQTPGPDRMTQAIERAATGWRDIVKLSDDAAADLVRKDKIDILIDLSLHSGGNRLGVFARKPAPVQFTFLGYSATTGLATIDYRISDPFIDPPNAAPSVYSEETIRLPHSQICYRCGAAAPPPGGLPAVLNGFITFGSLNNFSKFSDPAVELWARVLRQVPQSRLLLLSPPRNLRQPLINRFTRLGIAPERLELIKRSPIDEYLQTYERIDIALDPFPYNGTITTCDALWMGVPVVALYGKTSVGRTAASILHNVGLPELAAQSPDDYVRIAVDLADDWRRLLRWRADLRGMMLQSPLMDAARFTRDMESAFRAAWRKWCLPKKDVSA